jgi:magnesium and cobalt transporter
MSNQNEHTPTTNKERESLMARIRKALRTKPDTSLREALEEYIDQPVGGTPSVTAHEKSLIANILKLRNYTVTDVMIPRADIVALEVDTPHEEVLKLLAEKQYSRLPVYRDTLDKVLGTVHIKDMSAKLAQGERIEIKTLIRETMFVSPAMHVLDLLLQMRQSRRHLVMVVDEFGGIDGLVTIGDVIEAIIGEIDDEHEMDDGPLMTEDGENAFTVDARMSIESFEERFGRVLSDAQREESDTLGGLIFSIAGRVPARGEVLTHDNGMVFEVLEADPRRVNRVRISNIPQGKT